MKRVVVLGCGGAGKSTLARSLGAITGLPVIELDKLFWQPGRVPSSPARWAAVQRELVRKPRWIIDGDLGPYDVPSVRLKRADTVIVLDLPLLLCAWRALRRSRESLEFWLWLWRYRRHSRPLVAHAISTYAANADVQILASCRAVRRFDVRVPAPSRV